MLNIEKTMATISLVFNVFRGQIFGSKKDDGEKESFLPRSTIIDVMYLLA